MQIVFRCLPELAAILPKPVPAKRGLPDWLRRMPMSAREAAFDAEVPTVKRCPPFLDAMSHGFLMPLPCDVHFADGSFEWDWRELPPSLPRHTARTPLSFHVGAQLTGTPLFAEDVLALKFMNPWIMATEPGISLLVTHPFNRQDLPFRTVTGLVDSDRYVDNYVHFPALWVDEGFSGTLPKGTPVAQCVPVRRAELEMRFEDLDAAAQDRLAATQQEVVTPKGAYRRRFRSRGE